MIHVNRGATSLGAFPEEQVREGIRAGRFLPSDLGWREGMASWQPLSQFTDFADDIAAAPATSAPPPQTPTTPAMIAPTAGSTTAAPRSGLPWDDRHSKGLFSAFIETLQMILTRPSETFTAMRREGGLGEPLLYAIIGGSFGLAFYFIYHLAFQSLGMFANRPNPLAHLVGAGIGGVILIIFVPVLVAIGAFINAAILHVCLMIVGGAKQPFETTFRVICFASGSVFPLMVVPLCGGVIAGVWDIVLRCIGLARAHETETGRAVLAVLLPLIVCCGGGFLILMMFGALGAWSASQH
ncbi:MAG TPA: YIP1 family protein [Chthoniobacterales bacterium]|nr:YIP1 family protein [Chthoniobacterales bacterium]